MIQVQSGESSDSCSQRMGRKWCERPRGESGWAFQPAALDLNVFWHLLG